MDEELVNELITRLDNAAAKLSEGATAGWEILLFQQQISGVGFLVAVLLAVVVAVAAWRVFGKQLELCASYDQGLFTFWQYAVTLVASGFGAAMLYSGVARLLNPGYYAIIELLGRF